MSKFQYYTTESLIRFFIEQGKEGDCWDFKQEWHENINDLIKDIICFANTVHDEDCYIIFGVSDSLEFTGMKKTRRKQADIIDAISNLVFAGDIYPKIDVKTLKMDGVELDVLTIFNVENTPVYLKRKYGGMCPGCIYTRIGDRNTPDNGNADMTDIELLWKKRLGLTKPLLEYIYDRLHNKTEWSASDTGYYNVYRPEYTIEILENDDDLVAEFYAYAMPNSCTSYKDLNIKYQTAILDSYQIAVLDGGRLTIPTPEWGFVCHNNYGVNPMYSYKYYVCGSKRHRLFRFLHDPQNGDHRFALAHLQNVVLFYYSEEERLAFETYIEANPDILSTSVQTETRYDYIHAENEPTTTLYRERLKVGLSMNKLLKEWRKKQQ